MPIVHRAFLTWRRPAALILRYFVFTLVITPPWAGERSIVMSLSVCVCVCLVVREHISGSTRFIFNFFMHVVPYLWPYLGPVVAALRYVMYFRFYR